MIDPEEQEKDIPSPAAVNLQNVDKPETAKEDLSKKEFKKEFLTQVTAGSSTNDQPQKSETDPAKKPAEVRPTEGETKRRESLTQRVTSKLFGRKGSVPKQSPSTESSKVVKPAVQQERLKPEDEKSKATKSALRISEAPGNI